MRNPVLPAVLQAGLLPGCSDSPVQPDAPELSFSHTVRNQPALHRALGAIRQATAKYHDTDVAGTDGYVNLEEGITGPPGAGDMGARLPPPGSRPWLGFGIW